MTTAPRSFRFVKQIDRGGRPESDAALDTVGARMVGKVGPISFERPLLKCHLLDLLASLIARLEGFRLHHLGDADPEGKVASAITKLRSLEREIHLGASGPREAQPGGDVGDELATDPVTDAAGLGLPLVSVGQAEYARQIHGDPRTGRLDVRA